jgi:hypothetical protein
MVLKWSVAGFVFQRSKLIFPSTSDRLAFKIGIETIFLSFKLGGITHSTKCQVASRFSSFFAFVCFSLRISTPGDLNSGSTAYNLGSFSPKGECVRLRSEQQPGKLMPNIYAKGYEQNACEAARLDRQTRGSAVLSCQHLERFVICSSITGQN